MKPFLTLALLALALLAACQKDAAPPPTEANLRTEAASTGEISRIINASGRVRPRISVQVGSEISGRILEIRADYNSVVKEGDILAIIDPETFQSRVEQARAGLADAQAQIRVRDASIDRATFNLEQARAQLVRTEQLFAQDAASVARLETARRDVGVAEADLALAQAQADAARSSLRQSEASVRNAELDLQRTIIRSPIDGIVIERKVDAGQTVAASFSAPELFLIANDLASIEVDAAIVESDVSGLDAGDPASFTVDAYPATPFRGQVTQLRLNSTTNSNIVTYTAVIEAANPDGQLMPGMTANLQIITDIRQNVLRIPAAAERFRPGPDVLAQFEDKSAVAAVDDWTAMRADIEARLSAAGLSASRISPILVSIDDATSAAREILADPEQGFRRTPALKQLRDQVRVVLESSLTPTEWQAYRQSEAEANAYRTAEIWVVTTPGRMQKRTATLGLSDGAFVEVISGVEPGEVVVLGVGGGAGNGAPGGRPGGGGGRPAMRR